jgi:LysR family transcriptional regulator, glycine cleavage system transcriptional activator
MLNSRRFLPSISLLSAFESAARTQSFSQTARELDLTQSAVSRQIMALEGQLGVELFVRDKKRVHLTLAGERYANEIRAALKSIASASLALKANPEGGTLNLAILPTFGTRWLAPRLPDFLAKHPGVTVNLTTRLYPFNFESDRQDAAIHFGRDDWPMTHADYLFDETVIPVCSPEFLNAQRITKPEDFLQAPLLHLATRPDAWPIWLSAQGVSSTGKGGMVFDQIATMAQGCVHGIGLALLPEFLIENELATGKLVPAMSLPMKSVGSYFLVWPSTREGYPPLERFRAWLKAEARTAQRVISVL